MGERTRLRSLALPVLGGAVWLALGCATTPYEFATYEETSDTLALQPGEPQVERGTPHAWLDGFGHYFFSLPAKLILFDWKVDNHDIPPEVEESLVTYLHANGLCNTKVRLNQYAPGREFKRLFANKEVPAGWRYTLGVLSLAFYTIFPERLFAGFPFIGGGDHYNPYTNSISVYSGRRPIALHEGGHAKDFMNTETRQRRGLYAASRSIPYAGLLVALWQEAVATNDALSWELATAGSDESKSAYRHLYPAYSTYVGGTAETGASFLIDGWVLYAVQYGTVLIGHAAGQTRAAFVEDRATGLEPQILDTTKCSAIEIDAMPPPPEGPTPGAP